MWVLTAQNDDSFEDSVFENKPSWKQLVGIEDLAEKYAKILANRNYVDWCLHSDQIGIWADL